MTGEFAWLRNAGDASAETGVQATEFMKSGFSVFEEPSSAANFGPYRTAVGRHPPLSVSADLHARQRCMRQRRRMLAVFAYDPVADVKACAGKQRSHSELAIRAAIEVRKTVDALKEVATYDHCTVDKELLVPFRHDRVEAYTAIHLRLAKGSDACREDIGPSPHQ